MRHLLMFCSGMWRHRLIGNLDTNVSEKHSIFRRHNAEQQYGYLHCRNNVKTSHITGLSGMDKFQTFTEDSGLLG
jgi:hypothetical protein